MKALIWIGCIFLYSSAQTLMTMNGQHLGVLSTVVLAVMFVFVPAPLLCKQYTKWREKRDEMEAEVSPSPAEMTEETPLLQEDQIETTPVSAEEIKSEDKDHTAKIQDTDPPSNLVVLDLVRPKEEGELETKNGCNKNGKWFIPIFILSCVLAVSLCVLVCITIQQSAEINELKTTVSSLQDANSTLELQRSRASDVVTQLTSEKTILRKENDFWENHAVIILPDETYHRYGCSHISNQATSLICDREIAKELGYSACPDCKPLTAKERFAQMISE